jgi:hypothetical protein
MGVVVVVGVTIVVRFDYGDSRAESSRVGIRLFIWDVQVTYIIRRSHVSAKSGCNISLYSNLHTVPYCEYYYLKSSCDLRFNWDKYIHVK